MQGPHISYGQQPESPCWHHVTADEMRRVADAAWTYRGAIETSNQGAIGSEVGSLSNALILKAVARNLTLYRVYGMNAAKGQLGAAPSRTQAQCRPDCVHYLPITLGLGRS